MDEQNSYVEHVDEADLDLFYGFFDSVMKESSLQGEDAGAAVIGKIGEWAPEPFEEFLVGLPSQELSKHYALNPVSQQLPVTIRQQPKSEKGAGVGFILGLSVFATIMFSAYSLSSDPQPLMANATQADIAKIEQGLTAVEAKVESVQALKQQVTALESRLQELSARVNSTTADAPTAALPDTAPAKPASTVITSEAEPATTERSPIRPLLGISVSESEGALIDLSPSAKVTLNKSAAAWVVNLASSRSSQKAATELSRLQALGIEAQSVVIDIKGKAWTRIRVVGYSSKDEALNAIQSLQKKSGLQGIWIGRE